MGFFGGFSSTMGDEAQKNLDQMRTEENDQRSKISEMYWQAVKNPEIPDDVREHAFQQLEGLYKSPASKQMFKQLREAFQLGRAAHDHVHGQMDQQDADAGAATPGMPKPPAYLDPGTAPFDAEGGAPPQPQAQAASAAAPQGLPAPPSIQDVTHGAYPSAETQARVTGNATTTAEIEHRRRMLEAAGIKPGTAEYQYGMGSSSGNLPPIATSVSTYKRPDDSMFSGRVTPAGIMNVDTGEIEPNVVKALAGQLTPRPIRYKGPNGQDLFGSYVNGKLIDQEGQPLPPGTEAFDASLVPTTSSTTAPHYTVDQDNNVIVNMGTSVNTRTRGGLPPPPQVETPSPAVTPESGGATPAAATPPGTPAAAGGYATGQPEAELQTAITSAAARNNLDPQLALAVANQESRFNNAATSPKGARGIFQLMPGTARDLGIDPSDPAQNIEGGVKYLSQMMQRFTGDVAMALGAYNWGMKNVDDAVQKYGDEWLSHAPEETQNYVAQITGGNPAKGGGPSAAGGGGRLVAGVTAAQPLIGPDGQPVHRPLSAVAKNAIGQTTITLDLVDQIMPELDDIATGKDKNKLWDSVEQRSAWQQYLKLGIDPSNVDSDSVVTALPNIDPRLAKLFPTIAMLQVVGAQPWLRNIRRFEFLQQVQQHLPDPEKDTPELMVSKLDTLSSNLPNLMRAAYEEEGITQKPYKMATVTEVKKYAADSGQKYEDVAHTLRRGGYKITRTGK